MLALIRLQIPAHRSPGWCDDAEAFSGCRSQTNCFGWRGYGMIGDPSGKSQERNLLDVPTLRHNQECLKQQLAKFLDFESKAPNAAEMVNNYDWMSTFTFLDFIRDIGKHLTVNYMMAKDSVKKRLDSDSGSGMSFTEFTYQLVQGTDFLHLYEHKNCKLQMGGSDQWGNITTGTELIRRKLGGEAFC